VKKEANLSASETLGAEEGKGEGDQQTFFLLFHKSMFINILKFFSMF